MKLGWDTRPRKRLRLAGPSTRPWHVDPRRYKMSAFQVGQPARPAGIAPRHEPVHFYAANASNRPVVPAPPPPPPPPPQANGEPVIRHGDAKEADKIIVTVAFGGEHYMDRQRKFLRYADMHAPQYSRMVYNTLPTGCPQHGSMALGAYAFKIYALEEAIKRGYRYVMWLDTTMMVIRPMQPLWDHIAKVGW